MLAVQSLLLAAEFFHGSSAEKQGGNKALCNNIGALHSFAKNFKQVPISSNSTDVKRALREVNRRPTNKYYLDHVQGHQDRTKRFSKLSLEAQLNVECDRMTKGAVKGSMTKNLREIKQQLTLENACVFVAGRK